FASSTTRTKTVTGGGGGGGLQPTQTRRRRRARFTARAFLDLPSPASLRDRAPPTIRCTDHGDERSSGSAPRARASRDRAGACDRRARGARDEGDIPRRA